MKKTEFYLIILILLFFIGCSGLQTQRRAVIMEDEEVIPFLKELFDEDFPLPIVNPLEIDEEMKRFVDNRIRAYQNNEARFNTLVDAIFYSTNPVIYNENITNTAIDTFYKREGNCLSLTNMFIALSRYAGLETFFLEVLDHIAWTSSGNLIVNNGHIIAGMDIYRLRVRGGMPAGYITVDFYPSRPKSYRHLQPVDDIHAIAYFYNNLGVELLKNNDLHEAEIVFNNLLKLDKALDKALDKIYNNLGATHSKKREFEKAYKTYKKGYEHNNQNISILTNLVLLSNYMQKQESYDYFNERLQRIRNTNPYFFIQLADRHLNQGDHQGFLESIKRAERLDPTIPDIYILYVKYYIMNKRFDLAQKSLERAEALKIDQETSSFFHNKIEYFTED